MITRSDSSNTIQRKNVSQESEFSIKATAKSFEILSSALYSDKILAIIRELSCNAYDSHVCAGKKDVPIEICLPTRLNPTFYVKDFGIGLSDFDVRGGYINDIGHILSLEEANTSDLTGYARKGGIYNTYFESTKTNSNDFIGQLGLGSKSPFSYTSTFIVESRFHGIRYLYSCYKNESGLPSVTLMESEPTDDCNGITITIPSRMGDVDQFNLSAKKALMYFKPAPIVVGRNNFIPYTVKHSLEGKNWKLREADDYSNMRGLYVIQGFVSYPVNLELVKEHGLSHSAQLLETVNMDLYVPIGNVEVAASREALSYTSYTIKNLIQILEDVAKDIMASFQQKFDEVDTSWEMNQLQDYFSNSQSLSHFYSVAHRKTPCTWRDEEVTQSINLDLTGIGSTEVCTAHLNKTWRQSSYSLKFNGKWHAREGEKTTEFPIFKHWVKDNTWIFVDDTNGKRSVDKTIKLFLESKIKNGIQYPSAIIIRPRIKGQLNVTEAQKIVNLLDSCNVQYVTLLPKPEKRVILTRPKKNSEEKLLWLGFQPIRDKYGRKSSTLHRKFSANTWDKITVDMKKGGFYIHTDRHKPLDNGKPAEWFHEMISDAKKCDLLPLDTNIIGIKYDDMSINTNNKWINIVDHIKKLLDKNKDTIHNQYIAQKFYTIFNHEYVLFKDHSYLFDKHLIDGSIKKFLEEIRSISSTANDPHKNKAAFNLLLLMKKTDSADIVVNNMWVEWKKLLSKYEMLQFITSRYSSDPQLAHAVINYINLIDQQGKN